jgi:hypothetical protein
LRQHGALTPEAIASETSSFLLALPFTWPVAVGTLLGMTTRLLLGTRSDDMADRVMKVRVPSATAARWCRLSWTERSVRSLQVRAELRHHGWDEDFVRELVHGIDPDHPTWF